MRFFTNSWKTKTTKPSTCFSKPREHNHETNPHENINPKTPKLYKSTNLGDEKRGLPLESDSLQNSFDHTSLKWSEMVKK